jgi:hypothetical protein
LANFLHLLLFLGFLLFVSITFNLVLLRENFILGRLRDLSLDWLCLDVIHVKGLDLVLHESLRIIFIRGSIPCGFLLILSRFLRTLLGLGLLSVAFLTIFGAVITVFKAILTIIIGCGDLFKLLKLLVSINSGSDVSEEVILPLLLGFWHEIFYFLDFLKLWLERSDFLAFLIIIV